MLKNYLKTALRTFWKHKWFTIINIVGLTIGMSAALVIYLIAHYDLSFDKFEPDADRIYRVVTNFNFAGSPAYNPGVCTPLPAAVKSEVSGLEASVPVYKMLFPDVILSAGKGAIRKLRQEKNIAFTTGDYFKLLGYKWIAGGPPALNEPYHTVITADRAALYFPGLSYQEILGKTITYDSLKTTVAGIVAPLNQNTGFSFHDLISYSTLYADYSFRHEIATNNWGRTSVRSQLLIKLNANANPLSVTRQLNEILRRNQGPDAADKHKTQAFALQPLKDIHFNTTYGGIANYNDIASKTTQYGLLAIAAFLLVLAAINFINLNTAQGGQRAREIGIRKTLGSSKALLVVQFLAETFVITAAAFALSIVLAPSILRLFADFIAPGVKLNLLHQPFVWCFGLILIVVVSLAAGSYPALVLSSYQPVAVLKDQAKHGGSGTRKATLRKLLTVSQFVIAQVFVIATIVVSKQIYYATHQDLGFKKDAIITLQSPYKNGTAQGDKLLFNKLQSMPGVSMVSMGHDEPASDNTSSTEALYRDGKKEIRIEDLAEKFGDENYIRLYHIKLLAGRNLQPADTNRAFLVNETFVHTIGIKHPDDAVGKVVDGFNGDRRMIIAGVVADFN